MDRKTIAGVAIAAVVAALLLITATAFAASGDYGVNSGASTSNSGCGGTDQPACSITVNGHSLTFSHTATTGWVYYKFDSFNCVYSILPGTEYDGARGSGCDDAFA